MATCKIALLLCGICCILASCQDDEKNLPVLENKRRIECERKIEICDRKDGMRFWMSMPRISQAADSTIIVQDIWSSFLVCCDVFQQIMDSITLYNDLIAEANRQFRSFDRQCVIGGITVRGGVEFYGLMNPKRIETLSFGDEGSDWLMPTGQFFQEHKEELMEAHRRCCLD
jgi:hypothetical protein